MGHDRLEAAPQRVASGGSRTSMSSMRVRAVRPRAPPPGSRSRPPPFALRDHRPGPRCGSAGAAAGPLGIVALEQEAVRRAAPASAPRRQRAGPPISISANSEGESRGRMPATSPATARRQNSAPSSSQLNARRRRAGGERGTAREALAARELPRLFRAASQSTPSSASLGLELGRQVGPARRPGRGRPARPRGAGSASPGTRAGAGAGCGGSPGRARWRSARCRPRPGAGRARGCAGGRAPGPGSPSRATRPRPARRRAWATCGSRGRGGAAGPRPRPRRGARPAIRPGPRRCRRRRRA